jgi:UDP-N-acetylmuramate dehydrogenase
VGLTIHKGPQLKDRTTLKLGGRALAEIVVENEDGMSELPDALARLGGRPFALGWGSNVLAADGDLDVVLVTLPSKGPGIEPSLVYEQEDRVRIRVPAGLRLPRLLSWCAAKGYFGLGKLAGIPGTVGGAVAMNAGSYGAEMKQLIARVLVYSPCCGLRWVDREDVHMGYRFFSPRVVDEYFLVAGVELDLMKAEAGRIREIMKETIATKKASQPIASATAGCVFKNPDGNTSAGKLLDGAGFRGFVQGGVGFSEQHANFLVHHGGGTAEEAFALIDMARAKVRRLFDVDLHMEVKTIG